MLTYYYHKGQKDLNRTSTFYILPLIFGSGMFFFPIGGRLARAFNPKVLISCIAPIGIIGMFVSSFMDDYWAWLGLFCTSFGFTFGTLYIVPLHVAWMHFP